MTKEEIKEELLNDDQQQTNIIINAQFMALYTQLIKKGIMVPKDLDEMDKFTKEYIDMVNDKLVNEIFEKEKEEEYE